jgi:hypothetical protein
MRGLSGVLAGVLAIGCGGHSNRCASSSGYLALKSAIDLSHAIGFAVAPPANPEDRCVVSGPGAMDAGGCEPSSLYRIMDDGSMISTAVAEPTDPTCTSVGSESATLVLDTPGYEVIAYDGLLIGETAQACPSVVVRKSDGALFCDFQVTPKLATGTARWVDLFEVAAATQTFQLLDMSMDPPASLLVSPAVAGSPPNAITVDASGAVLVGGPQGIEEVYTTNGAQVPVGNMNEITQWLANGSFYYTAMNGMPASDAVTYDTYQLDASTFTAIHAGSFPGIISGSGPFLVSTTPYTTATQAYLPAYTDNGAWGFLELLGASAGTFHAIASGSPLRGAIRSGADFFIGSFLDDPATNTIVVANASTLTQTSLPLGEALALTAAAMSQQGELTFSGTRASDGAHVLGICTVAAGCRILNPSTPGIVMLRRID